MNGGAYRAEDVAAMMQACKAMDGTVSVPWLRAEENPKMKMPPLGPAYGKAVTGRVKQTLNELTAEDGGVKNKGEVVFY